MSPRASRLAAFPWTTAAVCAASVAVYALAAVGRELPWADGLGPVRLPGALDVVALGGRSTPLVRDAGQVWRLLTCHLVHTSMLHLVFNLAFLFSVGGAIEHVVRRLDYAAFLLFVAVASAGASLVGTPQVSAGASGLVFGVLAAAVVLGVRHRDRLGRRLRPYFGLWVLPFLVIVLGLGVGNPSVDQASHFGGLAAGVAGGLALELHPGTPVPGRSVRLLPITGGVIAGAVLLAAPWIAGARTPPERWQLDDGATVEVPSGWRPRWGPLGELEFTTAGGMVVLTTDRIPHEGLADPAAWYERQRLAALRPAGRAEASTRVSVTSVRTRHGSGVHLRYALRRDDTAMVRDVYVLDATETGGATVVSVETPRWWADAYAETRASIVGSIRSSGTPTAPDSVSAAGAHGPAPVPSP